MFTCCSVFRSMHGDNDLEFMGCSVFRSMLGDRDSEFGVLIRDKEFTKGETCTVWHSLYKPMMGQELLDTMYDTEGD